MVVGEAEIHDRYSLFAGSRRHPFAATTSFSDDSDCVNMLVRIGDIIRLPSWLPLLRMSLHINRESCLAIAPLEKSMTNLGFCLSVRPDRNPESAGGILIGPWHMPCLWRAAD
jgi:hypothetical protein